jgi:hypothetical protein
MRLGSIAGAVIMIGWKKDVIYDEDWSFQRWLYCYASTFLRCRERRWDGDGLFMDFVMSIFR